MSRGELGVYFRRVQVGRMSSGELLCISGRLGCISSGELGVYFRRVGVHEQLRAGGYFRRVQVGR